MSLYDVKINTEKKIVYTPPHNDSYCYTDINDIIDGRIDEGYIKFRKYFSDLLKKQIKKTKFNNNDDDNDDDYDFHEMYKFTSLSNILNNIDEFLIRRKISDVDTHYLVTKCKTCNKFYDNLIEHLNKSYMCKQFETEYDKIKYAQYVFTYVKEALQKDDITIIKNIKDIIDSAFRNIL